MREATCLLHTLKVTIDFCVFQVSFVLISYSKLARCFAWRQTSRKKYNIVHEHSNQKKINSQQVGAISLVS